MICYLPNRHAPLSFNYESAAYRYGAIRSHAARNVTVFSSNPRYYRTTYRKRRAKWKPEEYSVVCKQAVGFVWKGWTKRAACPRGGRRQPDSLISAAWDSGRRDLDWPKSTPQRHYSLCLFSVSLLTPTASLLPSCMSFPLYSGYWVCALLAAWVRDGGVGGAREGGDNRKKHSCCISTFMQLSIFSHTGER